jgi:hypothetical protein
MADLMGWQAGNVVAAKPDGSGSGTQRTGNEIERRTLARSIRSDEPDDFAFPDFKGDAVDREKPPEAPGKIGDNQHRQRMA